MKFYFLLFLILSNHAFSDEINTGKGHIHDTKLVQSRTSKDKFEPSQFHIFLLQQEEIEIKLDGIQGLIHDWNENNKIILIDAFDEVLTHTAPSNPAYQRIVSFCNFPTLYSTCAQHDVPTTEEVLDKDNIMDHVGALFHAQLRGDQSQIDQLMDSMAQASQAHDDFEKNRALLYDYAYEFIKTSDLTNFNNIWGDPNHSAYFEKIHSKYAQNILSLDAYLEMITAHCLAFEVYQNGPFPPLNEIDMACSDQRYVESCMKIARTMKTGNRLVMQLYGHHLLEDMTALGSDKNQIRTAVFSQARFTKHTECLKSLPMELKGGELHPAYLKAMLKTYSEGGNELQALKQAAFAIDQAFKDAGLNIKYNPQYCEEILAMDDAAFIQRYSAEDATLKTLKSIQ